ncbi:cupin domain-containing protein [Rhizobium leguminosarum]|uniref:cupin domain-containing protein n=1 Tax=Rhizobium ruizarguesonis TaxID=2081791 RepID=UPI0013DCC541|nr:cupin domain-containing protein [Rhizobium ruizarguesonis]NEH82993.1 cupin domain-containing protein [Rhizobium ruizarguesonis]
MSEKSAAIFSNPLDGVLVEAFGTNIIRIPGEASGAAMSIMEVILRPGDGTPLHLHEREDETFRVLSGTVGFWCGDNHQRLATDGIVFLPRGIPHRIENVGNDEARVMVILTPGGFEQFFVEIASDSDEAPETIAERFGLRFL